MNRVPDPSQAPAPASAPDPRLIGLLAVLASIAIHVVATIPGGDVWGLNALRYLSTGQICLAAALGGVLVLTASSPVRQHLASLSPAITDVMLAVAVGAGGWLLRDRSHLLGDGGVILTMAKSVREYHEREPFSTLLASGIAAFSEATGLDCASAFEASSVLLGVIAVLMLARADRSVRAGGLLLALGFLHGAMQLWFGYVEHYPPVALMVLAAVLAARRPTTEPATVLPALGAVALAILLHVSSVLLLPMAGWIVLRQAILRRGAARALLAVEILAVIAGAILLWEFAWRGMDVPSLGGYLSILEQTGRFGYGGEAAEGLGAPPLFSWEHLAEYGNLLALIGSLSLPLLLVGAVRVGPRILRDDPWTVPLALAVGAYLAAQFKFFPNLGAPRDWDVLAAGAFPFGLLAARFVTAMEWRPERALPWIVALACIHTLPWILVNASPSAARARFEEVPLPRAQATFVFATRDLQEGRLEDALQGFVKVVEEQPNSIHAWHRLGITLDQLGRLERAMEAYERALRIHEVDPRVPRTELEERLGYCLWRLGRQEEALVRFRAALDEDPSSLTARLFLAIVADGSGRPEEVLRLLQPMIPRGAENPAVLALSAKALIQLGRPEEAEPILQEAVRLFPDDPGVRALLDSR